jgi:hypothetical protein
VLVTNLVVKLFSVGFAECQKTLAKRVKFPQERAKVRLNRTVDSNDSLVGVANPTDFWPQVFLNVQVHRTTTEKRF